MKQLWIGAILWSGVFTEHPLLDPIIQNGSVRVALTKDHLPWGGYWWPNIGMPLTSSAESPLQKYDRFVLTATGKSSDSTRWENQWHSEQNEGDGHCNGWAAASVLIPEPNRTVYDPASGLTFFPSDLKALYSEIGFCANAIQYGSHASFSPEIFHKVLLTYLGSNTPVATDISHTDSVENRIISGASFDITKVKTEQNTYYVTAHLKIHTYDRATNDQAHLAESNNYNFSYYLYVNDDQKIIGGKWTSSSEHTENRPDFFWIPLSLKNCFNSGNQKINLAWIKKIESLPDAHPIHQEYEWKFEGVIAPGASVPVIIPFVKGTQYRINLEVKGLGDGVLRFHGYDRDDRSSSAYWYKDGISTGNLMVSSGVSGLQKIELHNTTSKTIRGSIKIKGFDYFMLVE